MDVICNQGYQDLYYCRRILNNLCDFYILFLVYSRKKGERDKKNMKETIVKFAKGRKRIIAHL